LEIDVKDVRVMAAALLLGSLALAPAAMAASAHNLQSGTHTANANDSREDADNKQQKQEQQAAARSVWAAFQ
jgi:ribosomal protein L12E/L44/L45/RPP1/RPP2